MMRRLSLMPLAFVLMLSACSDDPTEPVNGDVITLTQAQATALVTKVESFGAQDATLRALSDTIDVVIKAGAEARRIEVTSDIGNGPYWAVSLQVVAGTTSTFSVVAFDDPSNPTRFIILGGAVLGSSTPVNSASGSIGTNGTTSLTGHLLSQIDGTVFAWHVSGGSESFTVHPTTQSCPSFSGPGTCMPITVDVTFNFTASIGQSTISSQRTGSGSGVGIPGVRLSP